MNLYYPDQLPITAEKDRIVCAIKENRILVIAGDTGSGKTTQLPKMCLEAGRGVQKMIGCTQPRRIAAVSMAARVAEELRQPDLVGYAVRFQDKTGEATRIKFMTDGLLLAESRRDRLLGRYDTIILDEAHERSLNIDFLSGCLKGLLQRRRDLKLIISSATIDTDKFSAYFNDAPIIKVSGRTFPISMKYCPAHEGEQENYVDQACAAVRQICTRPGGDVLVFMPTERDILDTVAILRSMPAGDNHLVLPLFGRLQAADQKKIFQPSKKRKIVVATNVAETSITVPGIRFVVDTGLARIPTYNVRAGTTNMRVQRIAGASCDQRAGRCGRTGPGVCIRLYDKEDYQGRPKFTRPEIQRSNLAEVILQMIALGLGDPRTFPFIDPPTGRAIREGFRSLKELGAINKKERLTRRGRIMARLPLDPRIARIIVEGARQGALREIIVICSALSIQDPRTRPAEKEQQAARAQQGFIDGRSDFLTLLNIWDQWQEFSNGRFSSAKLKKFCTTHYLSWQRMREWFDIHAQISRLLAGNKEFTINTSPAGYAAVHKSLASGFLRNIGKKKQKNIYMITGGREVTIFPGSVLHRTKNRIKKDAAGQKENQKTAAAGASWIVAADFVETSRLFARMVAVIDEQWLEELGGSLCTCSYSDPYWAKKSGRVMALQRVSLFGLPIVIGRRVNYGRISEKTAAQAREIFIRQALIAGELGGHYSFLEHNRRLQKHFSSMEDRLRRRSILADDQVLYDFYRTRIGRVYDRFTLNRLLKKRGNDTFLFMRQSDICTQVPHNDELYRFPEKMPATRHSLPLSYVFKPGSAEDGVSVRLRPEQLHLLSPTLFEWLVPGLVDEKILHLLKGLPKNIRRRLVPLPDTVELIMDRIDLYAGSLYPALEQAVLKSRQVQIRRSDWRTDSLPRHLLMRYLLVDADGKIIACSRNFNDLLQHQQEKPAHGTPPPGKINNLPKKNNIGIEHLEGIADRLLVTGTDGDNRYFFPALVGRGHDHLDLCYIENEQQARLQNRQGLALLYCREFPGFRRQLHKDCKASLTTHCASWLSLGMQGKLTAVADNLAEFILDALFHNKSGVLPGKAAFMQTVEKLRQQGIGLLSRRLLDDIMAILAIRRQTVESIHAWADRGRTGNSPDPVLEQEFYDDLQRLLPADFLTTRTFADLTHAGRYLKALAVRVERAGQNPGKDALKKKRLAPVIAGLAEITTCPGCNEECRNAVKQYRRMVEEFRVSVFAPELGTPVPVSEKRLAKLRRQVEDLCRRVE